MGPIVCVCVCVCVCVSLLYTLCIALCVAAIRLLEMSREVSDLDRICEERSRHSWLFPNHSPSKKIPKAHPTWALALSTTAGSEVSPEWLTQTHSLDMSLSLRTQIPRNYGH